MSGFETSPERPPTAGCASAYQAAATEPTIAMTNSMRSVTTTPQRPEVAEYAAVTAAATRTVVYLSAPSRTPPILMPASSTAAMIITLKNTPRYTALNPRRKTAARPEYRSS